MKKKVNYSKVTLCMCVCTWNIHQLYIPGYVLKKLVNPMEDVLEAIDDRTSLS